MLKPSEKFIERLRQECQLDLPPDTEVHRIYAGYWQRKAGAASWMLWAASQPSVSRILGYNPITELLKANRLIVVKDPASGFDIIYAQKDTEKTCNP